MERSELAKNIFDVSHLEGNFLLRSGQTSNEYFDKYLFESDPVLLQAIAVQLAAMIPDETEVLAGLEMGGVPIATAISMQTGIPAVFVRKQAKEYGTCKLAEGIDLNGKKVCIIEDVVTTGGQIVMSANDLRQLGADITCVLSVILRDVKGKENLDKASLKLFPLFTMEELKAGRST